MLMSTISVNLFLSISNAFKQFDLAYVNNGGPGSATALLSYRIYKEAFVNYQYGSACAMSVVLMVIIGIFIIAQQMLTKRKGGNPVKSQEKQQKPSRLLSSFFAAFCSCFRFTSLS